MDTTGFAARLLEPVPANRSFGLHVRRADPAGAEVELDLDVGFHNVIGSLHSSGLVTLVDAAGLAAMIGCCRDEAEFDGITVLGTAASLQFIAPARGRLIASCQLEPFEQGALRELLDRRVLKEELDTFAEVHDRGGSLVCRGRFTWKLRCAHARLSVRPDNGARPGRREPGSAAGLAGADQPGQLRV